MQTNSQLNQAGGENPLEAALLQAFSDSFTMYYRAHAFHWNVKGPEFSQFHDFFATIYEDVYGSIDSLAENIRKIACDAPLTLNDICGMSRVNVSDVTSSNPMDMTASLRDANEVVMSSLNVAFSVAVAVNEQGVADFIAGRLDSHKKWAWQLSTTLGADDKPKIETSSVAHVEHSMPIEIEVHQADDMDEDMDEPEYVGPKVVLINLGDVSISPFSVTVFCVYSFKQKIKRMLTGYQRQLFSELVNLNWETNQEYPQTVKTALINEYWRVRKELEDDMGRDEYSRYINGMKQMFAPAK
jgi:starvation-inducible DNA-binding protein